MVVISGDIRPLICIVTLLITPFFTTNEPPSRGWGVCCDFFLAAVWLPDPPGLGFRFRGFVLRVRLRLKVSFKGPL